MKKMLFLFSLSLLFAQCGTEYGSQKPGISGLWVIQKVEVADQIMTPVGRWVELNADSTQTSGNGWKQHSRGTWSTSGESQLKLMNKNGFTDPFNDFTYSVQGDTMYWGRTEGTDSVTIVLARAEKKPAVLGDLLYGIWKLETAQQGKADISSSYNPDSSRFLFIRWDNRFRDQINNEDSKSGFYQTHGHRAELNLIYTNEDLELFQFRFEASDDTLKLRQVNIDEDSALQLNYSRIFTFPE